MTFEIFYDKQPTLFLKKSDKHIAERIIEKIEELLKDDPVPHQAKAIVGEHGVFRVRIGDYRALYRIDHRGKKIIIFELDKRPKVY